MKVKVGSRLLVVGLAIVALGWASPRPLHAEETLDKSAARRGQTVFNRYCVACHGRSGKGDGSLAKDLRSSVPDITQMSKKNKGVFPFERIAKLVDGRETARAHGSPDMPAWGDAFQKTSGTDAETVDQAIRQLTHFIWSLQRPPSQK